MHSRRSLAARTPAFPLPVLCRFLVDEPVKLGGKGLGECRLRACCQQQCTAWRTPHLTSPAAPAGPNPLSVLLGSLVGCTQYTTSMIAREMKLGPLGAVAWSAAGAAPPLACRPAPPSAAAASQHRWLPAPPASSLHLTQRPCPSPCAGEYDLRGVRGNEPGVDARFQRVWVEGTFDAPDLTQEALDRIAQQAGRGWGPPGWGVL